MVTVTRGVKVTHYVGQLAVDSRTLTLALSNLAGVPLATITWDGTSARVRPRESGLKPLLMTALLEFTLAPPERLRTRLHGLALKTRISGGREERRLSAGDKLVARAVTRGGVRRVDVPRGHLTVVLRPLPESDR